ncbi:MAG: hypothetical protein DRP90_04235, partial [Planctomycetota bacterium]
CQADTGDIWCVLLFKGAIAIPPGSSTLQVGKGNVWESNFDLVLLHLDDDNNVLHLYHPPPLTNPMPEPPPDVTEQLLVPVPSVPEKCCFLLSDGAGGVLVTGRFTYDATIHTTTGDVTFDDPRGTAGAPFSMFAFRYRPTLSNKPDFAVSIPHMRPDCVSMESGGDFWFGGVLEGGFTIGSDSYANALLAAHLSYSGSSWNWDFAASGGGFTSPFEHLRMAGLLPASDGAVAFGAFKSYDLVLGGSSLLHLSDGRWNSFFCRVQFP